MKKLPTFLAGMLTMALIVGLGVSALATSGQFTITVDPVNIQVNGAIFAPKDAKGNDVPVFAYGGTTYAPLRALAEAYGLTVGYDGTANMATVAAAPTTPETPKATYSDWSKEDEAAYQEFRGMWEIKFKDRGDVKYRMDGSYDSTPWESYTLTGPMSYIEFCEIIEPAKAEGFVNRLAYELRSADVMVELYFISGGGMVSPVVVK